MHRLMDAHRVLSRFTFLIQSILADKRVQQRIADELREVWIVFLGEAESDLTTTDAHFKLLLILFIVLILHIEILTFKIK